MGVRARLGRDCAARLRVSYSVPRPLTPADASLLPEAELRLSEFSAMVEGARDHVQLRVGGGLTLSFVVGDTRLEAVYGKLAGAVPRALIALVEGRLAAAFGPIAWDDALPPGAPPW